MMGLMRNIKEDFLRLLVDRHLGEAVVAECVKHFVGAEVGNTTPETFDRFRYEKNGLT